MVNKISDIIDQLMGSPIYKERWLEHQIKTSWSKLMGEKMSDHIKPYKYKTPKLTLCIDEERWVKAFEALKERIREKLNKRLGQDAIQGFEILLDTRVYEMGKGEEGMKLKEDGADSPCDEISRSNVIQDCIHDKGDTPARKMRLDRATIKSLNMIKDTKVRIALEKLLIKSKNYGKEDKI